MATSVAEFERIAAAERVRRAGSLRPASPPPLAVSSAVLRAAVVTARRTTSGRKLAEEIGISAAGLRYFLRGGEPYARTLGVLVSWYVRNKSGIVRARHSGVREAIVLLLEELPGNVRPHVEEPLADLILRAYAAEGIKPPRLP